MIDAADFVHLHVHSQFSLLEASGDLKSYAKRTKDIGQVAMALTDNGNLFGAPAFQRAAKDQGIHAIFGMDCYLAPLGRLQRTRDTLPGHRRSLFRLVLLATNEVGWNNLVQLSSLGYLEGFYYKPRIDRELLEKHSEGLIALSGAIGGEIAQSLLLDRKEEAKATLRTYQELFGRESFYLEVVDHGTEEDAILRRAIEELAAEAESPIVATNDVYYVNPPDWRIHDIALCIGNSKIDSDATRFRMPTREHWLKTAEEMFARFEDRKDALLATRAIAERCQMQIPMGGRFLPAFAPPAGETSESYFRRLCTAGVDRKYPELTDKVKERLEYEIDVITKMGFVDYFLITWDFIRYARENSIPVGPGRGSAAGSIVSYALDITQLDPLRYDLLFERFLNSERISMPDIDIDFCKDRRGEVIQYVEQKYGRDHVAQIITFGTMKARGVIRDVGRALDIPLPEVDKIAKKIPAGPKDTLASALEGHEDVRSLKAENPRNEDLFAIALGLEGAPRHASIHAAGVVITDRPLNERVPLYRNGDDVTTQWSMDILEEVGLLKMDFLGLRTLTIIQEAVRNIKETRGIDIDIEHLPLSDVKTYAMLSRGEASGVFQLESDGMIDLLRRLKPDRFEDLVAVLALYRPGPLNAGMVDTYVRRKHGQEPVTVLHPLLAPILEESLGVIIYQEQVMRIANVLAGFSLNEADNLRKAMGKKKPEILAKFKQSFVDGAERQGVDRAVAAEIFDLIEFFAGYGFNKSHSAAYALVTYQTAWLKANYPVEYMAGLLTCEMIAIDKTVEYVEECRERDITVLPPDINHSDVRFKVDGNKIRFALTAIKGVGSPAVAALVEARQERGEFNSIFDLCERVDATKLNRTSLEAMIHAGALDCLKLKRSQLLAILDEALRTGSSTQKSARTGQGSLFGFEDLGDELIEAERARIPDLPELEESERLAKEKSVLGFYLTGHPLRAHQTLLKQRSTATTRDLEKHPDSSEVLLGGLIAGVETRIIKAGKNAGSKMGIVTFEDFAGQVEGLVFSEAFAAMESELRIDRIGFLRGTVDRRKERPSIRIQEFIPLEFAALKLARQLWIDLQDEEGSDVQMSAIHRILRRYPGKISVYLRLLSLEVGTVTIQAGDQLRVAASPGLGDELALVLGADRVRWN